MSTPLPDTALVAKVRAGDDAAFSAIVERYQDRLLAFARRLLHGSGHDAEDVVQDAFIRAYNGLRATDNEMHLRPWLYMIVRNRAMDDLRRAGGGRFVAAELDAVEHMAPAASFDHDPAARAAERELLREVVAEMQRLPERQKLALVMRELDGASHVEMSDRLGTSIPATKSLLVRARTTLQEAVAA